MAGLGGDRDESSRLKKKEKSNRKGHTKTLPESSAPNNSSPSPSASDEVVLDKYRLHEKLEAVLRSVLNLYFQPLKLDLSNKESFNSSASDSDETNPNLPLDTVKNSDPRTSQPALEKPDP